MRRARVRALRRLSRRADPARAAALRSLRLARRLAGAALRRVQRAGGSRSRARGPRSSTTQPARRFVQAWKEHGQRRLAREAAALVAETLSRPAVAAIGFVPADGERALRAGPPAGRGARARARPRLGAAGAPLLRRSRSVERQRGLGLQERRRNVRGAFVPARASPPASAWSTTSTRAAPPPAPPRPRCGRAAHEEWRW